jgi:hypothetical protein
VGKRRENVTYTSVRQLAETLNVRRETVSDLMRALGIKPIPHPSNGRGYGLTPAQCHAIRDRLRPAVGVRVAAK